MYYIVNKETKEHEVGKGFTPWGWHAVEADDEGWIKWEGGECPLSKGSPVDVRHRDGEEFSAEAGYGAAGDWFDDGDAGDIIAYRPACYHEHKEGDNVRGDVWNGNGDPAQFSRVEVKLDDGRWAEAIYLCHHDGCAIVATERTDDVFNYMWRYWAHVRPIRTAEQRAVEAMLVEVRGATEGSLFDDEPRMLAEHIVDMIRAGRIPGVKLEEKA